MQRREHRPHHYQPRQRFTLQAFSDVSSREEGTGDPEGGSIDGGLIKDYLLLQRRMEEMEVVECEEILIRG